MGAYAESEQNYQLAGERLHIVGEPQWQGWLYNSHGRLMHHQGDWAGAEQAYHLALQLTQREPLGLIVYHTNILFGHLLIDQGALTEAATAYRNALAFHQQRKLFHSAPDAYAGMAAIYLLQNDGQRARQMVNEALGLITEHGIRVTEEPAQVYWHCIEVLQASGDPRAAALLGEAQRYVRQKANEIDDETLRQSFLTRVVANRLVLDAEVT